MENKKEFNKKIRQEVCYKPNKSIGKMAMCGVGKAYSFRIRK